MARVMSELWKEKCKDANPNKTVEKIKRILDELDIETEHTYFDNYMKNCECSRVVIKGALSDFIGTNGKGVNAEFCLASAYAELMERIQNRAFHYGIHSLDEKGMREMFDNNVPVHNLFDEIPENATYVKTLIDDIIDTANFPIHFYGEQAIREMLDKPFHYFPFYDVRQKRYTELPVMFCKIFSHSNGMAAGNTIEEAIVQACSEIFERYAQTEIMVKHITPPDLPCEIIEKYPAVKNIIDEVNACGKYKIFVRDCSLGKGLPVICTVILDETNQSFGVRFGAHPNMGVAIERSLTEAFQGRILDEYIKSSSVAFDPKVPGNRINLMDTKKTGNGWYPPEMILDTPSYEFENWDVGSFADNKQLVVNMMNKFEELGHAVYIQDVSFLGFPSVFVVAERASEVRQRDFFHLKETRLATKVNAYLKNIDSLNDEKVKEIVTFCLLKRNAIMECTINITYKLPFKRKFYAVNELDFLLFVCYFYLGEKEKAAETLKNITPEKGYEQYIKALKKYVSAVYNGYEPKKIEKILKILCDSDIAEKVISEFSEPKEVFKKLYPRCKNFDCDNCDVSYCYYQDIYKFDKKIWDRFIAWKGAKETIHRLFD